MRQLDITMCNDDELRDALYKNVITGNETAIMRKNIKELYAIMNRVELLEKVRTVCDGKLFIEEQKPVVTARELKRRDYEMNRVRKHESIKVTHITTPVIAPTYTPAEQADAELMLRSYVKITTLFDDFHIGVVLYEDTPQYRNKCERVARKVKFEGELIFSSGR